MKRPIIVFLFFFLLTPLLGQETCSGSLGENIFADGDFGFGNENMIPTDQGIAPGYRYEASGGSIDDGEYVITNYTGVWPWLYDAWLAVQDNGPEINGYMMVVNASFEPGLFYEQTINGLCENTIYEFSADIINLIRVGVGGHIRPNVSFLLDDQVLFSTGDVPQDERWHNYGFTFTTQAGQTSVKLSLRNNAPGGIGNDLALDNISFRACGPETELVIDGLMSDSICGDGTPITMHAVVTGDQYDMPTYQWQQSLDGGNTWVDITGATDTFLTVELEEGINLYRYLLANGAGNLQNPLCRINTDARELFMVPTASSLTATICEGESFDFAGQALTTSGTYENQLVNSLGCDSIVTLELTVEPLTNTQPTIQLSINDSDTLYCDTLYLGQSFSFEVNGQDVANNLLFLKAVGQGFNVQDYGIQFDGVSGRGNVSQSFQINVPCLVANLPNPNLTQEELRIDFVLRDSVFCSESLSDTTSIKLVLIKSFRPNEPPVIRADLPNFNSSTNTYETSIVVGDQVTFNVFAEDPDLMDVLRLTAQVEGSDLAALNMIYQVQSGVSPQQGVFSWTVDCSHWAQAASYQLQFRVQDEANECGVADQDSLTVVINIEDVEAGIFEAANAFSPNGDGIGESFFINQLPIDNCADQFEQVVIYNRWGKAVFSTTNRNFQWSGEGVPAGVYLCEVRYANTSYRVNVHLLR